MRIVQYRFFFSWFTPPPITFLFVIISPKHTHNCNEILSPREAPCIYPEIKILVTKIDPIHLKKEKKNKNTFNVQACGMAFFFFVFSPAKLLLPWQRRRPPSTNSFLYAQWGEIKRER